MTKTLYQVIYQDLLNKIKNNVYKQGERLPSELDLAQKYQVSRITSKRALNELEKDGWIKRVQGKGSFVKSQFNKKLENMNILYVMPFPDETTYGNYTAGLLKVFNRNGMHLHIRNSLDLSNDFMSSIENLYSGVIYYPQNSEEALELCSHLIYQEVPCVMLDKDISGVPFPSVTSDNFQGSYEVSMHLFKQAIQKPLFLSSNDLEKHSSVKERFMGFVKAAKEMNVKYDFYQSVALVDMESDFERLLVDIHQNNFDGIVCEHDVLAIKFISESNRYGLPLLPVVGFDNIQAAEMIQPSLTTVQQNFEEIGEAAANKLIELIQKPNFSNENIRIPTSLVIRNSSQMEE